MRTAQVQGELWGARAQDWAEIGEGVSRPLYEVVLRKIEVSPATTVLDMGCGAGAFCALAARCDAKVSGLDAAASLLAIAQQQVAHGDFRVGEIEDLPYADNSFDVVTAFNSIQYAATPLNALKEARRVACPGANVVVATWGKREDSEAAALLATIGLLLPPPPPGTPGPFALSAEGALEALAREAGLTPTHVEDVACPFVYPDQETALRGLLSAGPATRAIQAVGEDRVRAVIVNNLPPFKQASGGYRLEHTFRYLITMA